MICYKVLWQDSEFRLWSYFFQDFSRHSIRYTIDSRVYGRGNSKLFVFDSIESARNFIEGQEGVVVYKVEAYDVENAPVEIIKPELAAFEPYLINNYWDGQQFHRSTMVKPPKGTLVCGSLELLEEVDYVNSI